jgi:excisionase family DNA binding protein
VYKLTMKQITTEEAAARLGITKRRVQAMIKSGSLPAARFGRALAINESDLALVTVHGKAGRPPKAKADLGTMVPKPNRTTKKATAKKGGK